MSEQENQATGGNGSGNSDTYTDLTYLREMANGDEEFVLKMVNTYLENTPQALDDLEVAAKEENMDRLRAIAHKMKQSIEFMGISSIKETATQIEHYAKEDENIDNLATMVEQVVDVSKKAMEELRRDISN
ncbi:MAG: Hpt domain-containing protein [Bacteroidetes bacterium]|nr:Hpt domain-containing protein [Bacteroidota bacterium]